MTKLTDADNLFINEVLERAFDIADNSNSGDFTVSISKQDIRENTGRRIVRDVILESYSENLAKAYDTTSRIVGDKVVVNIPSNISFTQYNLNDLRRESDDIRNPEPEEE